ncbi:MAG: glycosyltransferase family protein [Bacteroidia bacterium]|nr:glycosyltransferase family protein [Bacteroidia bacterium]
MKKRPGIITQARMGSTRLPGKVFSSVGNGNLMDIHLGRLRQTGLEFAIATTEKPDDDAFIIYGKKYELNVYRGSEENVLLRFFETAEYFEFDPVIRVTSDCPLIDPALILRGLEEHLAFERNDLYTSNTIERTYPRGFDFEIFSFDMLRAAKEHAATAFEKEHVTPWIRANAESLHHITDPENHSDLRVTVDTAEDLELIRQLVLEHRAHLLPAQEITRILTTHPQLAAINAHIRQKEE